MPAVIHIPDSFLATKLANLETNTLTGLPIEDQTPPSGRKVR